MSDVSKYYVPFFSFWHDCPVCGYSVDDGCANGLCMDCADRFYDLRQLGDIPAADIEFYTKCLHVERDYEKRLQEFYESKNQKKKNLRHGS